MRDVRSQYDILNEPADNVIPTANFIRLHNGSGSLAAITVEKQVI